MNVFGKLLCGLALVSAVATAGPIGFGVWYEFSFFDAGIPAMGCFPSDPGAPECEPVPGTVPADAPPWTFLATGAALLTVTDAFEHGDAFEVYDFGVLIGKTPAAPPDFISCGNAPEPCLLDPLSSHASFSLGGGPHSITIVPYASPYFGGAAYFRADIPEPSTLVLSHTGLVAWFAVRRRKH